jgi:hypothetical protein
VIGRAKAITALLIGHDDKEIGLAMGHFGDLKGEVAARSFSSTDLYTSPRTTGYKRSRKHHLWESVHVSP